MASTMAVVEDGLDSGSSPPRIREALAQSIITTINSISAKLIDLEPAIRRLWAEFENLPKGETIRGCATKKEFCEKHLHRTPRAIRYMLNGDSNQRGEIISPTPDLPVDTNTDSLPSLPTSLTPSEQRAVLEQRKRDEAIAQFERNVGDKYAGFEKEYAEGWKRVTDGDLSLASFVRGTDWLKDGSKMHEAPMTVSSAAQTFLRFLSYETALPMYRARLEQLRPEKRQTFEEAWSVVREGIYGFKTDL
jgi:hypothetical protein